MATITGGQVTLRVTEDCVSCGRCVSVCPCEYLALEGGHVVEALRPALGCISCGQCAAVCPQDAIRVTSAAFPSEDIVPFPGSRPASDVEFLRLISGRRSIRHFTEEEVPSDAKDRILEAAQQAPVGIPPSDVRVTVLEGRAAVRTFFRGFIAEIERSAWMFSPWGVRLLRLVMSSRNHRELREGAPLVRGILSEARQKKDVLFYDPPLVFVFTSASGEHDPAIAATYAMLAAEGLGLGSCLIGTLVPLLSLTRREFREENGIPVDSSHGIALSVGVPKFHFYRAVRRRFAGISGGRG
ncbi:MAG: 4Fe-4S binding protein [Elusimicrobia bacterium]|nr:4Fe-4S binding protein [Elusimicrobiota bacterium]